MTAVQIRKWGHAPRGACPLSGVMAGAYRRRQREPRAAAQNPRPSPSAVPEPGSHKPVRAAEARPADAAGPPARISPPVREAFAEGLHLLPLLGSEDLVPIGPVPEGGLLRAPP
ncbi:MAG: hypothetical protein MZV64_63450 [Ignavibacteriales bacterium]|nr:hypothetical protein [Ignavibacteriales bacterium]